MRSLRLSCSYRFTLGKLSRAASTTSSSGFSPDPAIDVLQICAEMGSFEKMYTVYGQYLENSKLAPREWQELRRKSIEEEKAGVLGLSSGSLFSADNNHLLNLDQLLQQTTSDEVSKRPQEEVLPPFDPVVNTMSLLIDRAVERQSAKDEEISKAMREKTTAGGEKHLSEFNLQNLLSNGAARDGNLDQLISALGSDQQGGGFTPKREKSDLDHLVSAVGTGWDMFRHEATQQMYLPPAHYSPTGPMPSGSSQADPLLVPTNMIQDPLSGLYRPVDDGSGGSPHDEALNTILRHMGRSTTSSTTSSTSGEEGGGQQVFTLKQHLTDVDLNESPFLRSLLVPRETHSLFLELLSAVTTRLDQAGLVYWITGGTLLGCLRHGGMIPWDDDIDLCVILDDDFYNNNNNKQLQGTSLDVKRTRQGLIDRESETRLRAAFHNFSTGTGGLQYAPLFGYKAHHTKAVFARTEARLQARCIH